MLDALGAPAGKEDDRTKEQRYHDALAEAMRRLIAAGLLPERAGQPVKAWVHISLADLLLLDGDSALQEQWTAQVRERWAARRAFASETGSDGGAWLDGDAAAAIACDAAMAPIVTGDVNVGRAGGPGPAVRGAGPAPPRRRRPGHAGPGHHARPGRPLEQAVIGKAVDLLSGPGGLAIVPAAAAARRPPGRAEPAAGHRVRRDDPGRDPQRGDCCGTGTAGGPAAATSPPSPATSTTPSTRPTAARPALKDCVLLCPFHHQIVIHRWGWTLVLNPDGTTTAWNKDKTKVLHSHGPPARAG